MCVGECKDIIHNTYRKLSNKTRQSLIISLPKTNKIPKIPKTNSPRLLIYSLFPFKKQTKIPKIPNTNSSPPFPHYFPSKNQEKCQKFQTQIAHLPFIIISLPKTNIKSKTELQE